MEKQFERGPYFRHIREEISVPKGIERHPYATVVFVVHETDTVRDIHVGAAICSEKDQFSRARGRAIASARAKNARSQSTPFAVVKKEEEAVKLWEELLSRSIIEREALLELLNEYDLRGGDYDGCNSTFVP